MRSIARINVILLFFILIASIFFLVNTVVWQNLYIYSNSDLLYLPSFFRDYWEGVYDWKLWVLTPAPYFLVDFFVFFIASFFTSNLFLSFLVYAICFSSCLILATSYMFRLTEEYFSLERIIKAVTLCFALWFALLSRYPEDIALFLFPSYHASSILLSIILYSMLFQTTTKKRIALFLIVSTLAIASDKQIVYTFYLPFFFASFSLRGSSMEKYYLKGFIYFIISLLFSGAIFKLLSILEIFQIPNIPIYIEIKKNILQMKVIENINQSTPEFVQFLQDFYSDKFPFFLLLIVSVALNAYYSFKVSDAKFGVRLFSRFVLLVYFFSIFSQVFFGIWGGFRYVWGLYFFPYVSILFYLGNGLSKMLIDRNFRRVGAFRRSLFLLSRNKIRSQVFFFVTVFLFIGLIGLLLLTNRSGHIALNNPYPPFVSCLDKIQTNYSLNYGLSDYWNAKHIRYLSQTGLSVNQVFSNLERYDWIHNRDWYNKNKEGKPILYNFIIPERLDVILVQKKFGNPTSIEKCESKEIFIYEKGFSF